MFEKLNTYIEGAKDHKSVGFELSSVNESAIPYFAADAVANKLRKKGHSTETVERRADLALKIRESKISKEYY